MRSRSAARALGCACGTLLIAAGHYAIAQHDDAALWLGRLGVSRNLACLFDATVPCGVGIGLGLFLLGAACVALAIAAVPPPERPLPPEPSLQVRHAAARPLHALAVLLAALTLLSSLHPTHEGRTIAAWIATLLAGLAATMVADATQATPLRSPFGSGWERAGVAAMVSLGVLLVAHDLTHWRWSGTPDEAYFFDVAKYMARGQADRLLLSENGVFEYHPVLSSYYQSLFMRVFGVNVFGWRLSSAAAFALALPFVYLLTRELWNGRTAWSAALLFGSAQLAVGFAHLGYSNAQAYPIVAGSLALFVWSRRCASRAGQFLAGCVAGLGFYTYHVARLAPLLVVLLAWSLDGRATWKRRGRTLLPFACGVLFAVLPILGHAGESIRHMLQQTSVTGVQSAPESALTAATGIGAIGAYLSRLAKHWALSLLYGLWYKNPSHFQVNPIVDPLSGALAAVGVWLCIRSARTSAGARFLLAAFLLSALLVGATSQYDWPPLTRLMFLAPFVAMLAAVAVDQLVRTVEAVTRPHSGAAWAAGVGVVGAAIIWNVAAVHDNVYHRLHGYTLGTTAELVRLVQRLPTASKLLYIQRSDNDQAAADLVLAEYGMDGRVTYIRPFDDTVVAALKAIDPPLLVAYDLRDAAEISVVEETMRRRFPNIRWSDSDPGRAWNLRYLTVAPGVGR